MHTPDLLSWVKRSDIVIVQYILIELSDLKGFGYDLSDTQEGLGSWRNGIYILLLTSTSSPRDKDSGDQSRAQGILLSANLNTNYPFILINKTSGYLKDSNSEVMNATQKSFFFQAE